eukprot:9495057-Pyramimonas_sp.AAC.2
MGARLRGERLTVERALEEAVDRGEAADLHEALSCAAGHVSEGGAEVGPVAWGADGLVGRGSFPSGMGTPASSGPSSTTGTASAMLRRWPGRWAW